VKIAKDPFCNMTYIFFEGRGTHVQMSRLRIISSTFEYPNLGKYRTGEAR